MKTNKLIANVTAILLSFFLTIGMALAKDETKKEKDEEIEVKVDFTEFEKKTTPTIYLIDKNLDIKAEFYGDIDTIKSRFKPIFEKSHFLVEHNKRRVYLISE